jgi:4-carboxymuconolactone decarboxylase
MLMTRVQDIPYDLLTSKQKRIFSEIASTRSGSVRGPFAIWLRLPEIADKANQFGKEIRVHGGLEKRLFELAILLTAREFSAQYEWFAHAESALAAGLSKESIEAIRDDLVPNLEREDEKLTLDIVTELNRTKSLSQRSYERALSVLGLDSLIQLVTTTGFYTMVAMMLNAFDAPVPGGVIPLPQRRTGENSKQSGGNIINNR